MPQGSPPSLHSGVPPRGRENPGRYHSAAASPTITQPEFLGKSPTPIPQSQRSLHGGVLTAAHPLLWPVSQTPPPASPSPGPCLTALSRICFVLAPKFLQQSLQYKEGAQVSLLLF